MVTQSHLFYFLSIDKYMKPAAIKPEISIDDVDKLDVRIGTIEEVLDVPESRKLLKLIVDFGDHKRSILSGIRQERENPQEIVGQQALFIVNLPERKMAGELSQGMLFDIGYADGIQPVLAVAEKPTSNGARAG